MIVVKVELHSAITGKITELARMMIANEGGTQTKGDYSCRTYRGRDAETLERAMRKGGPLAHRGEVLGHARLTQHVWVLVTKCLLAMAYGPRS